ncbi:hypothetical protein Acife_1970 [Acidithiobacillus ferrivorans SS3]|uniref:Uncharacterized protein n=1 Tax=Acidithiobacillus ferrivorans SS3 TaxID=743299 RepID=G0JLP2_9PROT|nr:hypothetical protein [Acidithiobacillus ferrivorans]AEM48091.1 hypothetical protein Acife_1970 [Acidithiobacillus ferrivorans SS3]
MPGSHPVEKWELHNHPTAHARLQQRDLRGSSIAAIKNMEFNVVRSDLQALYEDGRKSPQLV